MSDERRKAKRFLLQQLIELEFDRETFIPVMGIDISVRGVSCKTQLPLGLYSKVYLLIELDKDNKETFFEAQGQVLRCVDQNEGTFLVGIEYSDLEESKRHIIEEWAKVNDDGSAS